MTGQLPLPSQLLVQPLQEKIVIIINFIRMYDSINDMNFLEISIDINQIPYHVPVNQSAE